MRKILRVSSIFLLAALWVMAQSKVGFAQTTPAPNDPLAVFMAGAQALGNGGVEASLAYFADDAVIQEVTPITQKNVSTYTGKQQIRQWNQKLLDNHENDLISNVVVNGDKLTFLLTSRSDELTKAGIDIIISNSEWIITAGKIKKVTITATPESVAKLKQAGFNTPVTSQGQGGAAAPVSSAAPTSVPAAGFGPTVTAKDWLTLPLALVALIGLSGVGFCLTRRRIRR